MFGPNFSKDCLNAICLKMKEVTVIKYTIYKNIVNIFII